MKKLTRRTFLAQGAAAAGATVAAPYILSAAEPNEKISVAVIGCGGRVGRGAHGGELVAVADVDEKYLPKTGEKVKGYFDYRKMFDEMAKDIDAVLIGTPDHNHAPAAMMAIKAGKHVYCEKPLTYSIGEARALTEAARQYKVHTQMGNQGHCQEGYRVLCEWIWAGAVGPVKEIHSWSDRPIWPQGIANRPPSQPVPTGLHWDEWIGPAPFRDYHAGLHEFSWRGWWDFGCGALGDMGCHIMDGAFWSMDAGYPVAAELVDAGGLNDETYPNWSHVRLDFPARQTKQKDNTEIKVEFPAFSLHWWDGKRRPPMVAELEQKYKRKLGGNGTIYVGEKGVMYTGCYGGGVGLVDVDQHNEYRKNAPDKTIPRTRDNFSDFFNAIRTNKPAAACFDYAGPFTEAVLMGNLCLRAGKGVKIEWDGAGMKVKNLPDLNRYVSREYRKGWTL